MSPTRIVAVALAALGLSACVTSAAPAPSANALTPYDMPHVKRPNLVVSDIDRSLAIYRDILGLTAGEPSTSGPNSFSYPVFKIPDGTRIRSVTLSEPGEQRVLALTELDLPNLPTPTNAPHMSAVVIGVSDLAGVFEKIEALGLETTETRIAGGAEFKFIEQAFVDYDGHLIVLYEPLAE